MDTNSPGGQRSSAGLVTREQSALWEGQGGLWTLMVGGGAAPSLEVEALLGRPGLAELDLPHCPLMVPGS